jgi:hypothetical protein
MTEMRRIDLKTNERGMQPTKPRYETPLVVDLSTLAKGTGGTTCTNGSGYQAACNTGGIPLPSK